MEHDISYVFVLSLLSSNNLHTGVIIHLVRMSTVWTVIGFCLIGEGESYTNVRERIEKMIYSQMGCVEANGSLSIPKTPPER